MKAAFEDIINGYRQNVAIKYKVLFKNIVDFEIKCFEEIFNCIIRLIYNNHKITYHDMRNFDESSIANTICDSFSSQTAISKENVNVLLSKIEQIFEKYNFQIQNNIFENCFSANLQNVLINIYNTCVGSKRPNYVTIATNYLNNLISNLSEKNIKIFANKLGLDCLVTCFTTLTFQSVSILLQTLDDDRLDKIMKKICAGQPQSPSTISDNVGKCVNIANNLLNEKEITLVQDEQNFFRKQSILFGQECPKNMPNIKKADYQNAEHSECIEKFSKKIQNLISRSGDDNAITKSIDIITDFAEKLYSQYMTDGNEIAAKDLSEMLSFYFINTIPEQTETNGILTNDNIKDFIIEMFLNNRQFDAKEILDTIDTNYPNFGTDLDYKIDVNFLDSLIEKKFRYIDTVKKYYVTKVKFYMNQMDNWFDFILYLHSRIKELRINVKQFESTVCDFLLYLFQTDAFIQTSEKCRLHFDFLQKLQKDMPDFLIDSFSDSFHHCSLYLEHLWNAVPIKFVHFFTLSKQVLQLIVRNCDRKELIALTNQYPQYFDTAVKNCFSQNGANLYKQQKQDLLPISKEYSFSVERKFCDQIVKKLFNQINIRIH